MFDLGSGSWIRTNGLRVMSSTLGGHKTPPASVLYVKTSAKVRQRPPSFAVNCPS